MGNKMKQEIQNHLFDYSERVKGHYDYESKHNELDEVYAKAEAFDAIVKERDKAGKEMYKNEYKPVEIFTDTAFWNIDEIIVDYESGDRP